MTVPARGAPRLVGGSRRESRSVGMPVVDHPVWVVASFSDVTQGRPTALPRPKSVHRGRVFAPDNGRPPRRGDEPRFPNRGHPGILMNKFSGAVHTLPLGPPLLLTVASDTRARLVDSKPTQSLLLQETC